MYFVGSCGAIITCGRRIAAQESESNGANSYFDLAKRSLDVGQSEAGNTSQDAGGLGHPVGTKSKLRKGSAAFVICVPYLALTTLRISDGWGCASSLNLFLQLSGRAPKFRVHCVASRELRISDRVPESLPVSLEAPHVYNVL